MKQIWRTSTNGKGRHPLVPHVDLPQQGQQGRRGSRLQSILVLAEMVLSEESSNETTGDWPGKQELTSAVELLSLAVFRCTNTENDMADPVESPLEDRTEPQVLASTASAISPTMQWEAEEARPPEDPLSIVERGRLFTAWEEKGRRLG